MATEEEILICAESVTDWNNDDTLSIVEQIINKYNEIKELNK